MRQLGKPSNVTYVYTQDMQTLRLGQLNPQTIWQEVNTACTAVHPSAWMTGTD